MQPFTFAVHTETMSEADRRVVDQRVAQLVSSSLSKIGSMARSFRANRRPARQPVLTASRRGVGAER